MGMMRVQEARAGVVLGADVHDRTGRRLMMAGQVVDARALRVLKMWGVAQIDVVGAATPGPAVPAEPADPADPARLREEAEDRFRHADLDHPAVAELFRLVLSRASSRPAWRG